METFANNAVGNLNASILIGATSLVLQAGQGALFPATGNFRIVIGTEIIIVGARSGDTLSSLTRGAESTAAAAHNSADVVTHELTAGSLPGTELAYTEVTANATSTGTTAANAQAVITGPSFTYDGVSAVIIEFFALEAWSSAANDVLVAELYEDATDKGIFIRALSPFTTNGSNVYAKRRYTPAAGAKVHSVRFWNASAARTITVGANTGAAGTDHPMFLRITKA